MDFNAVGDGDSIVMGDTPVLFPWTEFSKFQKN